MTQKEAKELTGKIMARFNMIGRYVSEDGERAYHELLMKQSYGHARLVVLKALEENREPPTDFDLANMLRPVAPIHPERPKGNFCSPEQGRKIMREAWVQSSCERHGITEEEFYRRDEEAAKEGRYMPLRAQWAKTDRLIAERKAKGLPVDESGLTQMAPLRATMDQDAIALRNMFDGDPFAENDDVPNYKIEPIDPMRGWME